MGNKVSSAIYDVVSPTSDKGRNRLDGGDDDAKLISTALARFTPTMRRSASTAYLLPSFGDYLSSAGTFRSSRYVQEFAEIETVGKGAFGCVVRARNNIDGRDYAIKKIPVSSFSELTDMKVMREVRCLARLDHPNVVRYYSSWFEISDKPVATAHDDESSSGSGHDGDTTGASDNIFHIDIEAHDSLDASCSDDGAWREEFNVENKTCWQAPDQYMLMMQHDDDDDSTSMAGSGSRPVPRPIVPNDDLIVFEGRENVVQLPTIVTHPQAKEMSPKVWVVLYIQMEFCAQGTLQNYLERRDKGERVNVMECIEIFRQIVMGLKHVHENGICHRDLKPKNIFLSYAGGRLRLMIGDYGLAKYTRVVEPESENLSPSSTDSKSTMISNISNTPTPTSSLSETPNRSLSEGNFPDYLSNSAPVVGGMGNDLAYARVRANSTAVTNKPLNVNTKDDVKGYQAARPPALRHRRTDSTDPDHTQGVGTFVYR